VVICLGGIAWKGYLQHLRRAGGRAGQARAGYGETTSGLVFAHGAEYKLANGRWLLGSYHPSLQNTNTGRLTREMFLSIFLRAKELLANPSAQASPGV
jgi:uracil-DNA glycosylase